MYIDFQAGKYIKRDINPQSYPTQPHIGTSIQCMGSNSNPMLQAIRKIDIIAIIEILIESSKNINFYDNAATNILRRILEDHYYWQSLSVKDNETGEMITLNELYFKRLNIEKGEI